MRIFISCQQSLKNHPVPAYQFWSDYFKKGIEEANCEWIEAKEVDWAEGLIYSEPVSFNQWKNRTWESTVEQIKQQHQAQGIDLFLSYLYPQQISTSAIKEIQNLGIPCVNFFCDNVRQFTKVPQEFHCFDLNWVPEYKALAMYEKAGLNYVHAPMPVWIDPKYRDCQYEERYGNTFIGSKDSQRAALLAKAIEIGTNLEIRGTGWHEKTSNIFKSRQKNLSKNTNQTLVNQINFIKNYGFRAWLRKTQSKWQKPVNEVIFQDYIRSKPNSNEYRNIIQQSTVTLGINRYPSFRHSFTQPDTYSRMRDIEAPMMGACYLTEWTDGLDQMYDLGEEIETYRSPEELKEKISELEAKPEKRKMMRFLGQKRALNEHSFTKSLAKITTKLGV